MRILVLLVLAAFAAASGVLSACDGCEMNVPQEGVSISTTEAPSDYYFYGGVIVANYGHEYDDRLVIATFEQAALHISQVGGMLIVYGNGTTFISKGDGSPRVPTDGVKVETGRTMPEEVKEINVTVKADKFGTTVMFNDLGIEAYQNAKMPCVRIRSVDGSPITAINENATVTITNNNIFVIDS